MNKSITQDFNVGKDVQQSEKKITGSRQPKFTIRKVFASVVCQLLCFEGKKRGKPHSNFYYL
jgi:hypothetical protein